ncbi:hypothetical protein ACFXP7_12115 [Microbacterium sp. P06]|uniref:hypothetical protein n=1 Tax=unclassified Microbacterium TaxID=2609290 RepID=UPI0037476092
MGTGGQIATTIVVVLAAFLAAALPIVTLWRLRTPDRRRDEWLSANGQPRLTAVNYAIGAVFSLGFGLAGVLGALAGYPILWAAVVAGAGFLTHTIISAVVSFRPPADLE